MHPAVNIGGIPHLAKNERDAPNFLYAALDRTACAPFFKERRMKFREPTKLHRKSGVWGTRAVAGTDPRRICQWKNFQDFHEVSAVNGPIGSNPKDLPELDQNPAAHPW